MVMEYSEKVPVQYQKGTEKFMGMDISVDPRVLIPRPETELLVSVACDILKADGKRSPRVLDLCTGSGAVALGVLKLIPASIVTASDISSEALDVAEENFRSLGAEDKVEIVLSDMFSAFAAEYDSAFDCVISNPPYVSGRDYQDLDVWVKAEPRIALYAGELGMDYLRIIAEESPRVLKPGAFVAVEIGYDQADQVKESFRRAGLVDIKSYRDMARYERVITGRKDG
jgi:release factor glutamine methyltransferase